MSRQQLNRPECQHEQTKEQRRIERFDFKLSAEPVTPCLRQSA